MARYLPLLLAIAPLALAQNSTTNSTSSSNSTGTASSKRGIVYVDPAADSDNNYWTNSNDDMTWYYNYQKTPTPAFVNSEMQFVPMQWGAPENPSTDMSFYSSVKTMLQSGTNVTWVLGFNEPDGCSNGGSCVPAATAAQVWIKQFEALKHDMNIKIVGPACTGGSSGWAWLQQFHGNCSAIHGNSSGCIMDALPIHWYGNFAGLASHLGQVQSIYSNVSDIWVTEYAYNDQSLADSQTFYNSSAQYFDRMENITHYSYFGAFRSSVSNVGPNAAFLTSDGKLTDIGSWYLGGSATGNLPSGSSSGSGSSGSGTTTSSGGTYSGKPYSSGSRASMFAGWLVCVTAAVAWTML